MYIDELPLDAVQIKGSYDYIDPRGNVYGIERRKNGKTDQPFTKTQSTVHGYKCCGISYKNGQRITKRVHKLVAEAFIPNPNNLPIVMHKDNNKKNNNVNNLKWGTIQENTKQAYNDELASNAKGFDDNQSLPCSCYDTLTNALVGHYGSVSMASEETGVTKGGILFQINNPDASIRKKLYFVPYQSEPKSHEIVVQYDYYTDKEIARFVNIGQASAETGISDSVISSQVHIDSKPKWTKDGTYFKYKKIY